MAKLHKKAKVYYNKNKQIFKLIYCFCLSMPLPASADDQAATGEESMFYDELLHLTDAQAADRCLRHEARAADMYPCVVVMFSSGFACYKVENVAFVVINLYDVILNTFVCDKNF